MGTSIPESDEPLARIDFFLDHLGPRTILVPDVDQEQDDPPAMQAYRRCLNEALLAQGQKDETRYRDKLGEAYRHLGIFIAEGGQGHSNPAFEIALRFGTTLLVEEKLAPALALLELAGWQYARRSRESWKALVNQGVCHFKMGNYSKAQELAVEAFNMIPDEGIYINLVLATHYGGDRRRTEALLEKMPVICDLANPNGVARFHLCNDAECLPLREYAAYRSLLAPILAGGTP